MLLQNRCMDYVWFIEKAVLVGLVARVAYWVVTVHTLLAYEEAEEIRGKGLAVFHALAAFLILRTITDIIQKISHKVSLRPHR